MSPGNHLFNLGHLRRHTKWNYTYYPILDYADRFDGMTMQPKSSISKIAMSSNISETVSSDALSGEFVPPNEVLATQSNKPSLIAVLVIMSLFLLITISTTSLLLAFCRKKNTVFALQKCEEQDSEYELDDIEQTDIEMLKEEATHTHSIKSRSSTCPSFSQINRGTYDLKDSPTNEPLIPDSSAKLIIKSNHRKKDTSRMSKSKTFSVYYNAKTDDQTTVCNNILQMEAFHDGCDLENSNLYDDYVLESTVSHNACYTDDQTVVCNKVLQMQSFHDECDQESRNIYKDCGLESSIFHNACYSEGKKNVQRHQNPKEDYFLDSSIIQKPDCYTKTVEYKLQKKGNLPNATSMTTYVNNENCVKLTETNEVENLEDAILFDICSGHCSVNCLDNSLVGKMESNVKSTADDSIVDMSDRGRKNSDNLCLERRSASYLGKRSINTDSNVKSREGNSDFNTIDNFGRKSNYLCLENGPANYLDDNPTTNTALSADYSVNTCGGFKRNSDNICRAPHFLHSKTTNDRDTRATSIIDHRDRSSDICSDRKAPNFLHSSSTTDRDTHATSILDHSVNEKDRNCGSLCLEHGAVDNLPVGNSMVNKTNSSAKPETADTRNNPTCRKNSDIGDINEMLW